MTAHASSVVAPAAWAADLAAAATPTSAANSGHGQVIALTGAAVAAPGARPPPKTDARAIRSMRSGALVVAMLLVISAVAAGAAAVGAQVTGHALVWLRVAPAAVAGVTLLAWLYESFRAHHGQTDHTPAMAVAGWAVPIANLWLPALILRDLWRTVLGRHAGVVWVWMAVWCAAVVLAGLDTLGLHWTPTASGGAEAWMLDTRLLSVAIDSVAAKTIFSAVGAATHIAVCGLLAHIVLTVGATPRPAA